MEKKPKTALTAGRNAKNGLQEDVWIPVVCDHQCMPAGCLFRVHRVNGVAVGVAPNTEIEGFEKLTRNQGTLCPKPYFLLQKLYNPLRIKTPLKRTNPNKGIGVDPKWVEISWDEALNTIAEKLKIIRGSDTIKLAEGRGPQGNLEEGWTAFLKAFGPTQELWGGRNTHCRQAQHMFGKRIHGATNCNPDLDYCKYLLIFGANPSAAGGAWEGVLFAKAREEGIKIIAIDPVLSVTAAKADEWLPIRPGTDCAFILAMINVIVHELNVYDQPFLKEMTNSPYLVKPDGNWLTDKATGKVQVWDLTDGRAKAYDDNGIKDFALEGTYEVDGVLGKPAFQILKDHVKQYTPEWAASITDITTNTIRRITKEFGDNARIGSTINKAGISLPYRPAATYIGRGVTGQIHSYQTILADHILAALIGSIEVPGGHRGGHTFTASERYDGILWETCPPGSPNGVESGDDGMLDVHHRPFQWPPTSYSGWEILTPFVDAQRYRKNEHPSQDPSQTIFGIDQLDWRNLTDPPKGWPVPPFPEVWIRHCTNPLLTVGEPKYALEVIKKIPFIVSISYTMDEITDFADIVLPECIELEKYKAHFATSLSGHKKYFTLGLRQPVIDSPCNTMDVNDILSELADRAGFLDEFNLHMNEVMGFSAPYKLEPGRKYTWAEIVDRLCKYYTNGSHDLAWFKKNGAIVRPATVEEQYDIHLGMKVKKVRYPIPYMLEVKKAGEELSRNLAEKGIDWWPTGDYTALPTYIPPILAEVPAEYDFYVINCRVASVAWGMNVGLPWVIEVSGQVKGVGDVLMNAKTAKARGIKEGDEIWVESPAGKVKQKVRVCQGIRPDCLLISGQFGQWTMPIAKDTGRASFSTLVPLSLEWTDNVTGNQQSLVVKAKIYKE